MKLNILLFAVALLTASWVVRADSADPSAPAAPPSSTPAGESATAPFVFDEIDLHDADLRDALSLIGEPAGLNLAASDEASKTKVNIRLRNVTAFGAVQAICQTHGLFFNRKPSDDGIDVITTVKEFQDGLTVFREEKTQVYTLLFPNALDLAVAVHDLYGSRVRFSQGKEGYFSESDELSRRFGAFDQLDSRSQAINFGDSNGGNSSGNSFGSGNTSNTNTNTSSNSGGVITNTLSNNNDREDNAQASNELHDLNADQLNRISKLVKETNTATGIDADQLAALGRNKTPIYVTVIGRNNQIIVRTSDQTVLDEIALLKEKIDIPTPQVLLEVKVLSVDLSDGFTSIFDTQLGNSHNTGSFSTGAIQQGTAPTPLVPGGTGEPSGPFALNTSSLIYQYVSDNFAIRMQMLESKNRITTLATPMLLVANNEVSRVFIGQERPIVRAISSQTTATQGVVTSTPQTSIDFLPVGTTLLITPNINADRTVTLRLLQETSSVITGGATIPIIASNGTVVNQPVDIVSAQSLTGTLVAKDGLSLALGGLINENLSDTREEVPFLGKLPIIGVAFRRQATNRSRTEVIIVIRPFILSTPSEAEAVGQRVIEANSVAPQAQMLAPAPGDPIGSMKTHAPHEVLRANPPRNQLENLLRFHEVSPSDF